MRIKEFIPKILLRALKPFLKLKGSKEFANYFEAEKVCIQDAYQNTELCQMIADKTAIYAENLKVKPYTINPTNVFLLSAINQYLNTYAKTTINVLDFGGACGAHYFEIKRFLPKVNLKWFVVETAQMVKSAKSRDLVNDELDFFCSLEEIGVKIDFIYSSCALHYVCDPYMYTKNLLDIQADWILFNRMMFNENDRDFVTVQKSLLSSNGPGKLPKGYSEKILSYPHTTLSFKKFNSVVSDNNYVLHWIFDEMTGSYQIKREKIAGKGLLYTAERSLSNDLETLN